MTTRQRVARESVSRDHVAQFFDSDESRAEGVARFLAEGVRLHEPLLVVAHPSHSAAVVGCLESAGVPTDMLIADGRLLVEDGGELLLRISHHGMPEAGRFQDNIGRLVAGLSALGHPRVYGEIVDLLAQRGDLADAIRLEGLWNALAARVPMSLMCGYAAAHFVPESTHRHLRNICETHASVHSDAQDSLAAWLLKTAHEGSPA